MAAGTRPADGRRRQRLRDVFGVRADRLSRISTTAVPRREDGRTARTRERAPDSWGPPDVFRRHLTGVVMSESDLELASRRAIYQQIADTPGIHFRALLKDLDYAQGTLQYHLRWLADEGLLDVSDDGKYTRYYPAETFDDVDRTAMN